MIQVCGGSSFVELVLAHPGFDARAKLETLAARHEHSLELLQAVIDEKLLLKEDACRLWGDYLNIAYVDVLASGITVDAGKQIPLEIARKARAIGLYVIDGVLTIAMATPQDAELVRRLQQIAQIPLSPVFCLPCEIDDAISIVYATEQAITDSIAELGRDTLFTDPYVDEDRIAELAKTVTLAHVVDEIVHFALRERATDLHIEPLEIHSRIRFRVDGTLRDIINYPKNLHRAVVSRLKILADLNISESRFPQDGRFSIPMGTEKANFRLSIVPTVHGEKAGGARAVVGGEAFDGDARHDADVAPDRAAVSPADSESQWHPVRLRADGVGENDSALRGDRRDQFVEDQHRDDRGSGGDPAAGRDAVPGESADRAGIQRDVAGVFAAGPGRDSDRGDSRHGDGEDRDGGGADGAPRARDTAYEHGAASDRAADGDRRGALHGGAIGDRRAVAAAGGADLRKVQGGLLSAAQRAAEIFQGRRADGCAVLSGAGLSALPRNGVSRAGGFPRTGRDHGRDPADDFGPAERAGNHAGRDQGGVSAAALRRLEQGAAGTDDDRRDRGELLVELAE